ncbi:hypothetical protein [Actinoplanes philippinensis]|uniref:hypothetical protein n=1 Tax=Actinoplanes philippinensis TaxID=35752 RepID=UPI0033C63D98
MLPIEALSQPYPFAGVVIVAIVTAVCQWKREEIRADRDKALAELALKDSKPAERGEIIKSLATTKQFGRILPPLRHESGPSDEDARDEAA